MYATKEFTERQKKYAALKRVHGLVTPQLMCANTPFSSGDELSKILEAEAAKKPEFAIRVSTKVDGAKVSVSITLTALPGAGALDGNVRLIPLLVRNLVITKPTLGENRGARLVEHYTVLKAAPAIAPATATDKPAEASFDLPADVEASNLNITVLLENMETLRTIECVTVGVSAK